MTLDKLNNSSTKQYCMKLEKNCRNFELCNATLETIKKILGCLTTSKATSLDGISSIFLKIGPSVLPLCNLINLSIKQSLFPDQCKIEKLKILFKKNSRSGIDNR